MDVLFGHESRSRMRALRHRRNTHAQQSETAGTRSILMRAKSSAGILFFSTFVQSVLEHRTISVYPARGHEMAEMAAICHRMAVSSREVPAVVRVAG